MEKKRVAAYCRVSTAMEEQEGSYETQVSYYRNLITSNPRYTLVDVYGDHGASGRTVRHRPEFQRMIQDCEAGKIDLILSKSISRFARNLPDCISVIRKLCKWGIGVYFEKEALDTLAPNTELLLNCLAAIAEEESTSIGQNLRWAHDKRNEAGKPSRMTPYGYRKDDGKNWIIEPREARRVVLAFGMANRGECYSAIRNALNALEAEENTGKIWKQTTLGFVFRNEAYCGDILTNKYYSVAGQRMKKNTGEKQQFYIEEHHPALVPRAVFERVNELMERKLLWKNRKKTDEEMRILAAVLPMDVEENV